MALEIVCFAAGDSRAWLAPERGGLVTRFEVAGRPVLFMDESTLFDPTKNVRGGVPVLFPSPGPLSGDRFTWRGRSGAMKQHGIARNRPWRVLDQRESEVTLELRSDDATLAAYPWSFVLRHRYVLSGACLRIEQRLENTDAEALPFAMGFHPYFQVADADKPLCRVPTRASTAFDNVSKLEMKLAGPIALGAPEVDLHLHDHGGNEASLQLADGSRIEVRGSREYQRWVIWTLAGKDFVCLEPWSAGADALNREPDMLVVPPGGARELHMEIELVHS